jgi:hypothetical protein
LKSNEGFDRSFTSLGSAVVGVAHNIAAAAAGEDPLKGHPGRSLDILKYGAERLEAHAIKLGLDWPETRRTAIEQMQKGSTLCESPIERNILAALVTGAWPSCLTGHPLVHNAKDYAEAFPRCAVVIVPQMALLRYRADLGIVATRYDGAPALFVIECDGKAFHQDAAKDALRDAYFQALGAKVMRVSGRIANEAPISIADIIISKIDGWLR